MAEIQTENEKKVQQEIQKVRIQAEEYLKSKTTEYDNTLHQKNNELKKYQDEIAKLKEDQKSHEYPQTFMKIEKNSSNLSSTPEIYNIVEETLKQGQPRAAKGKKATPKQSSDNIKIKVFFANKGRNKAKQRQRYEKKNKDC